MFVQVILLLKSFSTFEVTVTNISLQISSHVLAYSNSCVNPILYALLSPPFLTGFRQAASASAYQCSLNYTMNGLST